MTNERLDEIAARVNAATPGPWFTAASSVHSEPLSREYDRIERDTPEDAPDEAYAALPNSCVATVPVVSGDTPTTRGVADAAFIANAREDVLSLLEEVRRLKAPLFKRVTRMAEAWRLTKREAEVLELLVQAYTNKDIGVRLGIADSTVEIHVSRVIHKSKCASRAEVIVAAYTGVVP